MKNSKQLDKEYIAGTYARFPINIVSGQGSIARDETGKEYIDLGAGIAVNTFGYCDKEWASAVSDAANKLSHTSNLYYTDPGVKLAEMLCTRTGMKKVFFSNSGAEANECAIKTARKYAADTKGGEYYTIITLKNSFHGRTIATLKATGQDVFHKDFGPFPDGFVYADPDDPKTLEKLAEDNKCAAVMIEVVQGEGGVMPLSDSFLAAVKYVCEKHNLLLICDEVQIGNGRSGSLYGYMNCGLFPDIVSTAKGLAGGLPLGATLLGEKVKDTLGIGSHGSTFGANPVCCSAAISVLSRIDDKLLAKVKSDSDFIFRRLLPTEGVVSVSGMGLMIGIETVKEPKAIISKCAERGVLVLSAKNKIRLLPPLNIPRPLLEGAINVLCEVIAE